MKLRVQVQQTWQSLSRRERRILRTFLILLLGANRVMLASQAKPAADFRVIVKTVKVYR
ncbi:MAG: hypothetical protein RBS80_16675 [Thermoguttaceae bacterium]|jgi:hypothetical protein|nr:hypothetical protein [Thermoguttaceae bacterium]